MLCARARGGGRHVASLYGINCRRPRGTRHCHSALSIPLHGGGWQAPDTPKVAQATVRAAVGEALRLLPGLAVVAGGKSFGGRMTSQAQAASLLPGVRGLVFLGFPLHPAGRPSGERGAHLFEIKVPMLFLQGTRDALAATKLMRLWSSGLVIGQPSSCSRTRIIHFMCPQGPGARGRRQSRNAG